MEMRKDIKFIAEIGMFAGIGLVLDLLASVYSRFIWTMGGSISFAMVPIFIMAFRWGLKGGLLTGLIVGVVQILWAGSGWGHPAQIILDYPLAYGLVGVAGILSKKIFNNEGAARLYYINFAIIIGGGLRTLSHILSGYIFFSAYTPDGYDALPWSIIYNLGYMVPSILISSIVIRIIAAKNPKIITLENPALET